MERRKFTREFKLEAVRLIKERGVTVANCDAGAMEELAIGRRTGALAPDAGDGQGMVSIDDLASAAR